MKLSGQRRRTCKLKISAIRKSTLYYIRIFFEMRLKSILLLSPTYVLPTLEDNASEFDL